MKDNKRLEEKKEKEISNLEKEQKEKMHKIQLLEMAVNGDQEKIIFLNKMGITGEYLKAKDNIIKIDPITNQLIGNEKNNKIKFLDFYDVIVHVNSIKEINKGWKIEINPNKNYEKYKNEKVIKIGVIGNSNKGKSFLLSKISKINLPSGTSIRTEGLSIKYPE